ncbi:copper resistance protein CopC [Streptosporangium sp. NPDC001559]|uniref:copper resistance CopC family protein n=1 Tax=Streptosporangium sp. NPDC001559 TaxID=3366187 RepID=UPI0036E3E9A4
MKTSPAAAALTLLAALLLGTALASPALAHDSLKSSDPAKGATVDGLDRVKLTFTSKVNFPIVVVHAKEGAAYQEGKPVIDGPVVTQRLKPGLPPGEYVIAYQVVSSDGHPIDGEIPFTLSGSGEPSPSRSATAAEPGAEPSAASAAEPAPSSQEAAPVAQAAQEPSRGIPGWVWIVVGGLVGIGIGLMFSLRGKRRS